MSNILDKMLSAELRSARGRNIKVDLTLFGFLSLLFIFSAYESAGLIGLLAGGLLFWHRYVILRFAKTKAEPVP